MIPTPQSTYMYLPPGVRLCLLLLVFVLSVVTSDSLERRGNGPRLLDSFELEGLGTFELLDSDPRAQAEAFCSSHGLTAAVCYDLAVQAESQFFHHQWLLQTTMLTLTDPASGASGEVAFLLFSGLGPVLQAFRFCEGHLLSPQDCLPIAQGARDTFYQGSRLLFETQLERAAAEGSTAGDAPTALLTFHVYDNLPPSAQALDACLLHGVGAQGCAPIVALAEEVFHPLLTSVTFREQELEQDLQLDLFERTDPSLAALAACSRHALPPAQCTRLMDSAELAYFSSLERGAHALREHFSVPDPELFPRQCLLYEGLDPRHQALRCCDRNGVSKAACEPVVAAVRGMFFESAPLARFTLEPAGGAAEAEAEADPPVLKLFAEMDPRSQVIAFCQQRAIELAPCLGYMEAAATAYHEAAGALLVPITLASPPATFLLYSGRDPALQAEDFCAQHRLTTAQCVSLASLAFAEYASRGNEVARVQVGGDEGGGWELVLKDNLDPAWQARHHCERHGLAPDPCWELLALAERLYFGAGDVISTLPVAVRGSPVSLRIHQHFDPFRQAKTFCHQNRISRGDCAPLEEAASSAFSSAGRVLEVVRMYVPAAGEDGAAAPAPAEQQLECVDNLDPEVQARRWCARHALGAAACRSLVDVFEATYFGAGDVILTVEFGGASFALREDTDPFQQAARFCRRQGLSLGLCAPLVAHAESNFYNYGPVLRFFNLSTSENNVFSFSLHDNADPAAQVARFCARHRLPSCEDLTREAEETFFADGTVLGTLSLSDPAPNATSASTLPIYSNLDPAVQAKRACSRMNLTAALCGELEATAERLFFRAGPAITTLVYELATGENASLTLYSGVEPGLQLHRFCRRHRIPQQARPALSAAVSKEFYASARLLASLNVTIDGEESPVELQVFDSLDPLLQTRGFCVAHALSAATCQALTVAAEEVYFGQKEGGHFQFSLRDKSYRFSFFDQQTEATQVERFCRLHDFSAASCEFLAAAVAEQKAQQQQQQQQEDTGGEDVEIIL